MLKEKDIQQLEDTPAYLRQNIKIDVNGQVGQVSRTQLDEKDGQYSMGSTNSYIDKIVD